MNTTSDCGIAQWLTRFVQDKKSGVQVLLGLSARCENELLK